MNSFSQGDIIKIEGYKDYFLIISCNEYIINNSAFHVCPILKKAKIDPMHISISGKDIQGIAIANEIKHIDPNARNCSYVDRISYPQKMNISDAIQGIFEYD